MRTGLALAVYYLGFYAFLGCWIPFSGLYYDNLGFSDAQIALLTGVMPVASFLCASWWGRRADASPRPLGIALGAALLGVVAFLPMFFARSFFAVLGAFALFAAFRVGSLPAVEAWVLRPRSGRRHGYGRVRVFGSLGFMLAVLLLGQAGGAWVEPRLVAVCLAVLALSALPLLILRASGPPPASAGEPSARPSLRAFLRGSPAVVLFLCTATCMQASHAPYYAYYSLWLRKLGCGDGMLGFLWALGVCAEVALFLIVDRWLPRFGYSRALLLGLGAAVLRWLGLAFLTSLPALIGLQLLHALTFGAFHVSGVQLAARIFPRRLLASGQSAFQALGYGLGAIIGQLINSALVGPLGYRGMFLVGAGIAAVGLGLGVAAVRKLRAQGEGSSEEGDASARSTR